MQDIQEDLRSIDAGQLLAFADALLSGNFTARLPVEGDGPAADAARRFNHFAQHMDRTVADLTRLSNELSQGIFGGQAEGVVNLRRGPLRECLEAFNAMEWAMTGQIRDFARIATRLAAGKTDQSVTVECHGETEGLKNSLNAVLERVKK